MGTEMYKRNRLKRYSYLNYNLDDDLFYTMKNPYLTNKSSSSSSVDNERKYLSNNEELRSNINKTNSNAKEREYSFQGTESVITETTSSNMSKTPKKPEKILVVFEWKEGGGDVKIQGNFSKKCHIFNLKKKILGGGFELRINLLRKKYYFRFNVDGKWLCSDEYEKIEKDGALFNTMDLRENKFKIKTDKKLREFKGKNDIKKIEESKNNEETETNKELKTSFGTFVSNTDNTNTTNNDLKSVVFNGNNELKCNNEGEKERKEFKESNISVVSNSVVDNVKPTTPFEEMLSEYGYHYPSRSQLNENFRGIPLFYKQQFNINNNTRQNRLGNPAFYKEITPQILSVENSYRNLHRVPFVQIAHLFMKTQERRGENKSEDVVDVMSTQRCRQKQITLVYFNRRNKEN